MVKRLFWAKSKISKTSGRKQYHPLLNNCKDVNSEVFVPDDSGFANGNIASGTADKELLHKTTLLNKKR